MELTLPHRFSKMLPIVTITQGMYCDVPKEENRVWDFLHVADEILYSVKTDNRGSCRVVDRAEFMLMSGLWHYDSRGRPDIILSCHKHSVDY